MGFPEESWIQGYAPSTVGSEGLYLFHGWPRGVGGHGPVFEAITLAREDAKGKLVAMGPQGAIYDPELMVGAWVMAEGIQDAMVKEAREAYARELALKVPGIVEYRLPPASAHLVSGVLQQRYGLSPEEAQTAIDRAVKLLLVKYVDLNKTSLVLHTMGKA